LRADITPFLEGGLSGRPEANGAAPERRGSRCVGSKTVICANLACRKPFDVNWDGITIEFAIT